MPLRFLIKTAITAVTPPVIFNSFPLPVTHLTAVEPPLDRRRVASLHFRDCTAVAYCGDTAVMEVLLHGGTAMMEVLLRSLYGATAVMAVPRRLHCGLVIAVLRRSAMTNPQWINTVCINTVCIYNILFYFVSYFSNYICI